MNRHGIATLVACVLAFALWSALPARAGMPDRVEPLRKKSLTREQYRQLRDEWKVYAEAHPTEARAWAQLSRAAGYAGEPCDVTLAYAEKAYRLGPDDPDACNELARNRWGVWCAGQPAEPDEAIRLLEHALAVAPELDDAHIRLWVMRLAKGERRAAEDELRSLLDRGRIPEPIVDFAYNELVGLAPNAILFTNGDNDTYPAVALQVARGFRTDVSIVNLSMLNMGWYRRMLREGPNPVPVPLLDQSPTGVGGAQDALQAVLLDLSAPGPKRPVYFAVTVAFSAYEIAPRLSLEGEVYRALPGRGKSTVTDTARIERNLGTVYRLQSATSPALDWNAWSSCRVLVCNYVAADVQLALARSRAGNKVGAGRALDRALRLCEYHHYANAKDILSTWRGFDPGSKELARWARRLGN